MPIIVVRVGGYRVIRTWGLFELCLEELMLVATRLVEEWILIGVEDNAG